MTLEDRRNLAAGVARVVVAPLGDTSTFADRAYTALKDTIVSLNVYNTQAKARRIERVRVGAVE